MDKLKTLARREHLRIKRLLARLLVNQGRPLKE